VDKRQLRRVFWGLASFEALVMFRDVLFHTYLAIYLRGHLGMSMTETTLCATLPMLTNVVFQTLLWGRVSDHFQKRRTLIIIGEVVASVGTVLMYLAHTFPESGRGKGYAIIIGLSIIEIFWSMSNVGRTALIADVYGKEERSPVLGRMASLQGVGGILGIVLGGLIYDRFGTRPEGWGFESGALFYATAGFMLISILPMLLVPEGGKQSGDREEESSDGQGGDTALFVAFMIGMAFIHSGRNSIDVICSPYLVLDEGFNVTPFELIWILNAEVGASIVLGLCMGYLCRRISAGQMLLIGSAISVVALIIYALASDIYLIYIGNLISGSATVLIAVSSYTFVASLIPPEKRGRLFGWFNATHLLSWGIPGTIIAGPIVDYLTVTGWSAVQAYRASFGAATTMTAIGLVIQLFVILRMHPRCIERSVGASCNPETNPQTTHHTDPE
jgi:MFS family permease